MKYAFKVILSLYLLNSLSACNGQVNTETVKEVVQVNQNSIVGGGCDGCELMYVGMPENILAVDTSNGWADNVQQLLITGTVYQLGGKIPAPNVIIYYWHTNTDGLYAPIEDMPKAAKKHGHIRGWVKTDVNGTYSIYTNRPGPYPNSDMPAHIHTSIKEPNIKDEYYIDAFVFDDDRLLNSQKRNEADNRGGSGVLRVLLDGKLQVAEHNIILGLNIPNYPEKLMTENQSGLEVGEDSPSFTPFHAYGPDKGSKACPVCKYGRYHGIVYFVGNNPNWDEIKNWLTFLDHESDSRTNYLKVYFVYGNENDYSKTQRTIELAKLGEELGLKNVALTFVSSFSDKESEVNLNKINPEVENTIVIYKNRAIIDKYVNLKPSIDNFRMISAVLDKTKNDYFMLPEPKHN